MDVQRAFEQWFGVGIAAEFRQDLREIVDGLRGGQTVCAERHLADGQRASEQRLRRGEVSLGEIEDGQIVERGGESGIVGPRGLLDLGDLRFELVRALLRCDGWRRRRGRRLCGGATAGKPQHETESDQQVNTGADAGSGQTSDKAARHHVSGSDGF